MLPSRTYETPRHLPAPLFRTYLCPIPPHPPPRRPSPRNRNRPLSHSWRNPYPERPHHRRRHEPQTSADHRSHRPRRPHPSPRPHRRSHPSLPAPRRRRSADRRGIHPATHHHRHARRSRRPHGRIHRRARHGHRGRWFRRHRRSQRHRLTASSPDRACGSAATPSTFSAATKTPTATTPSSTSSRTPPTPTTPPNSSPSSANNSKKAPTSSRSTKPVRDSIVNGRFSTPYQYTEAELAAAVAEAARAGHAVAVHATGEPGHPLRRARPASSPSTTPINSRDETMRIMRDKQIFAVPTFAISGILRQTTRPRPPPPHTSARSSTCTHRTSRSNSPPAFPSPWVPTLARSLTARKRASSN